MATPTIKIDQAGQATGTAGLSRADLVVGQVVTLTDPANVGDFTWELVTPPGSAAALTGGFTPTATFNPDVAGTYLVYVTSGQDKSFTLDAIGQRITTQGGAAVLLTYGTRPLGIGETLQFHATKGWAQDFHPNFALIDVIGNAINRNVAGEIASITAKSTVDSTDILLIEDASAANAKKRTTVSGLRITQSQVTDLTFPLLTAGAGLTGGGDLSADRTFDVVANADASIVVNANDIQVGVLANDTQHGVRGGGTQHAAATVSVNGFMSAADKAKIDSLGASSFERHASFGVPVGAGTQEATLGRITFSGSLIGLSVHAEDATTAGTLTVNVKVGGVTKLTAVLSTGNPESKFTVASLGTHPIAQNDEITVEVIADASYSNTPVQPTGVVVNVAMVDGTGAAGNPNVALLGSPQVFTAGQAIAQSTLADGAGIVVNGAISNNFQLQLTQNSTIAAPTNVSPGQTINIAVRQNGAGGFTLGFNAAYKFTGGAPTVSTGANAEDLISCYVRTVSGSTAAIMLCSIAKNHV